MAEAELLYGSSGESADILWAAKMHVPDPFLFLRVKGRTIAVMSDLEIGRARDEARVHRVEALSDLNRELKKRGVKNPGPADHAALILKKARVRRAVVPGTFPVAVADALRKKGIRVRTRPAPFFERRVVKTAAEIRAIAKCQRAVENAVGEAVRVLRRSRPRGRILHYRGEALTSQRLRRVIELSLFEQNCRASRTIVAGGSHACDPHHEGRGPLLARRPIILDVFPRSLDTGYCADMTRTVCRGKPSREILRLYDAVREGHRIGCRMIRAGVTGEKVHRAIHDCFEELGYKTGPLGRKMMGFFHGTGHGIGLEVHEPPRVSWGGGPLPAGSVVTCEPGLYYPGLGGVRIEDMLVVGRGRSRNLARFPKEFVI